MKEFWDKRYSQEEWAYGQSPNVFLAEKLKEFKPQKILFPAEGEGRNAVYAAMLGWQVCAFDFSAAAKERAEKLALEKGVAIQYDLYAFTEEQYDLNEFDAIGISYVHFDPSIKTQMHKRLDSYLKIGGHIIMEVFSKKHRELNKINPELGGPPNADMMYSIEEIKKDFSNYKILELQVLNTELNEGFSHIGNSSVLRFVAEKVA